MKQDKELKEIESNIKVYLQDGLFKKGDYSSLTEFYLDNAKKALSTADALMQLSKKEELKERFKLSKDFETYLWVITASYYSMFYSVNALLCSEGIKIGDKVAHKITSDVFYYYTKKFRQKFFWRGLIPQHLCRNFLYPKNPLVEGSVSHTPAFRLWVGHFQRIFMIL